MRIKDLKQRLPNIPDEYLPDILNVVNKQREIGYRDGVDMVQSMLKDIVETDPKDLHAYCVTHERNIAGG